MNELMTRTDDGAMTINFASAITAYSSFKPKSDAERVAFFNAVNSPSKRLKEMVNTEVEVEHIYAEQVEFVQEDGTIEPGVRIVFISPDGTSYQASSKGVFSSVQKLMQIVGEPSTWKKSIKIRPREVSKGANKNVLVFDLV